MPPNLVTSRPTNRLDARGESAFRNCPALFRRNLQLTTLVKELPSGDDWLHELKFDGYRRLPAMAEAVKSEPLANAIIDGEIIVVDTQGRSSYWGAASGS